MSDDTEWPKAPLAALLGMKTLSLWDPGILPRSQACVWEPQALADLTHPQGSVRIWDLLPSDLLRWYFPVDALCPSQATLQVGPFH